MSNASKRQSNIELCRLLSILLVMLVHTTNQSLGNDMSLGVLMLEGFSIVGVNVFILITGYFSTVPKKTSLFNLAFICLFWMVIKVICRFAFNEPITFKHLFFITSSNWFISSYIGLLFLTPILNLFCNTVSKKTLWNCVLLLLFIEIWFDWLPPRPAAKIGANNGYSVLSFAILYLLARAIRLYGLPSWFKKISPLVYVGCSLTLGFAAYFGTRMGLYVINLCFSYINPLVLLSSIAFLTMFEQMHFQSRFINYIAKSTLAVLLGHSAIFFIYTKQFKFLYDNYSGVQVIAYWSLAILIVFCASIAIDQLRILLFRPLEQLINKRIKNNLIFEQIIV